jgi:hypothetical protein
MRILAKEGQGNAQDAVMPKADDHRGFWRIAAQARAVGQPKAERNEQ